MGILLRMVPKGPFAEYLRRRSPLPAFLCGTPEMRWKKTFLPPDFAPPGRGHLSDPRLHVQFYAYYFRDTTLGKKLIKDSRPNCGDKVVIQMNEDWKK
jgi:hypothetical protein